MRKGERVGRRKRSRRGPSGGRKELSKERESGEARREK